MSAKAGGYDEGYSAVPCFWGTAPGSLVVSFLKTSDLHNSRVLDVGAGEGKNANALARAGATVDAIEISPLAIANGRAAFQSTNINWIQANAVDRDYGAETYDLVVSYGLVHCLADASQAATLIKNTKRSLRVGGTYILVSFNSGSHDLSAHPGFNPLLLDHRWFIEQFSDSEILTQSSTLLFETHPHNQIMHHHSLTRLVARKI